MTLAVKSTIICEAHQANSSRSTGHRAQQLRVNACYCTLPGGHSSCVCRSNGNTLPASQRGSGSSHPTPACTLPLSSCKHLVRLHQHLQQQASDHPHTKQYCVATAHVSAVLSARLGCGKGGLSWASEELLAESLQVRLFVDIHLQ